MSDKSSRSRRREARREHRQAVEAAYRLGLGPAAWKLVVQERRAARCPACVGQPNTIPAGSRLTCRVCRGRGILDPNHVPIAYRPSTPIQGRRADVLIVDELAATAPEDEPA